MKASQVAAALELLIESGVPAHIEGPPGVGKTSVVYQVAAKKKMQVYVTRLADREPSDFQIPEIDSKKHSVRWITPDEFPQEGCGPTVWFFDEWRQGMPQVQNVAGRLLNERCLGAYKVPDQVYICAASNRAKDRAATNRMPSHIASRFNWLSMEADVGDWCQWALNNGIETELIGFIRWRSELLSAFDPSQDVSPTCRAWEYVNRNLIAHKKRKLSDKLPASVEERLHAGHIGNGAAAELMGYLQVFRTLPDPSAMLMNPDKCEIPTQPATLCAICATLARKATDTNMDRVVRLANRMQDEYSVLLVTQAVQRDAKLSSTRPFISWAEKHQDALA